MIAEVVVSLLAVAGFALALWGCRVTATTDRALDTTLAGLMSMLDPGLDDDAKEVAVRRAGFALIAAAFGLLWRLAVALAAAAAPILLADALGLVSRDAVFRLMMRLDWILVVSVAAVALGALDRRWRPPDEERATSTTRYSRVEQFLHGVAFATPKVLTAASRIEDRLLSEPADEPSAPPIFVTSLARGGTTAMLNALHDVPGIATHTYRDMPFLTAPTLWNRLAGGRRRRVVRRERAHGDGLEIDLDSPEAFEEVVWRMFWPDKYRGSSIDLWREDDRNEDAEQFLHRHMEKVIHARRVQAGDGPAAAVRYCSKNNTNIARLRYLTQAFPGCRVVVPIRRPASHAASLLRQHTNFLRLQAEDPFIRRYMRDIGHFEFGLIHQPMMFAGFDAERYDPATPDYWLAYWIHACRDVLEHSASCVLVSQDDLRSSPQATMSSLCDELDLGQPPLQFAGYFRSGPDESPTDLYDQRLHDEAAELHRELEAVAVSGTAELVVRGPERPFEHVTNTMHRGGRLRMPGVDVATSGRSPTAVALAESGERLCGLLLEPVPLDVTVPGLRWTARETMAHLTAEIEAFTSFVLDERDPDDDLDASARGAPTAARVARVNDRLIGTVDERTAPALGRRLGEAIARYLDVTGRLAPTTPFRSWEGASDVGTATATLLAEVLVHGWDVAATIGARWRPDRAHAGLALTAVWELLPNYLDPVAARDVSMDVRIAPTGQPPVRVRVDDQVARVTAGDAAGRPDCSIRGRPDALLLLAFGRVGVWTCVRRGHLVATGRRPWVGLRLPLLFTSP